uniref:Uncharacterized protein LOC104265655 n=1 Tax=Phallusia mammillata TaxID=59560 RepID=A0A6F9DJJ9_9ASCI|nr:uncharacterized protein LOC104265655 [Phallusia mammillata]
MLMLNMDVSAGQVCPYCQMPLKLLHVQTINLHLEVCFRQKKPRQECPRGLDCASCMVCHYEVYSHNLLARKYSNNNTDVITLPVDLTADSQLDSIEDCESSNFTDDNNLTKARARLSNSTKLFKHKSKNNSCESKSKKAKWTETSLKNVSTCKVTLTTNNSGKKHAFEQRGHGNQGSQFTRIANDISSDVFTTEKQVVSTCSPQKSFLCDIVSSAGDFAATAMSLSVSSQLDHNMDSCNATSTQVTKTKSESKQINDLEKTTSFQWSTEKDKPVLPCAATSSASNSQLKKNKCIQRDIGSMLFGTKPLAAKNENQLSSVKPKAAVTEPTAKHHGSWKRCPFYKKIGDTGIAVDAFNYGTIAGISIYILSHFHYDHYMGLTKNWEHDIYCSEVTGNLLETKLRILSEKIKRLPMNKEIAIGKHSVTLLDANHCPGAVVMLFRQLNGQIVLHTGDFRADDELCENLVLCGVHINTLYLDTTYLDSTYGFPPQNEVVTYTQQLVQKIVLEEPKTLFITGTYSIGKERIFLGMARTLNSKIFVTRDKYRTMSCLDNFEIKSLLTMDAEATNLHVLPMKNLNVQSLLKHLKKFQKRFVQILAIKPTGWTHSKTTSTLEDIEPTKTGPILICGVPYSEHSSFTELKAFVERHKPDKIIPTVNVGRPESRQKMEKYLYEWKKKI